MYNNYAGRVTAFEKTILMISRVPLFLALTVAFVASVVAVALSWSSWNEISDDSSWDKYGSDTSVITGAVGSGVISSCAGWIFMLITLLFLTLLVTCDLDDVISDNSRFAALLRVSGVFAILNLVGAGLLIASLTSSSIDKDPIIKGVIAIVGTVIAACAEIVLVWVGTPEDRKEAFKNFFCKQRGYARINN